VEQSSSAEPRRRLRRYIQPRFIDPLRQMPGSRISCGINNVLGKIHRQNLIKIGGRFGDARKSAFGHCGRLYSLGKFVLRSGAGLA
jgi:hypothetical protein